MALLGTRGSAFISVAFGVIAFFGGVTWSAKTALFAMRAEHTQGTVSNVTSKFDSCKKGKRSYYDCTRFTAQVEFQDANNAKATTSVSAGTRSGHCTACTGDYVKGNKVPIIYNPSDLSDARLDSFGEVWGGPLIVTGLGGFFTLVGMFSALRRR